MGECSRDSLKKSLNDACVKGLIPSDHLVVKADFMHGLSFDGSILDGLLGGEIHEVNLTLKEHAPGTISVLGLSHLQFPLLPSCHEVISSFTSLHVLYPSPYPHAQVSDRGVKL